MLAATYDDDLADAFSALKASTTRKPLPDHFFHSFHSLRVSDQQQGASQVQHAQRHRGQYLQAHQPVQRYQHQGFQAAVKPPAQRLANDMDWERTYDPFHPLGSFLRHPPQHPPPRPSYKPKYSIDNPCPYWLEQAPFYEPPTRSDPFAKPDEVPVPTGFEIAVNTIAYLLYPILSSLLTTLTTTISLLFAFINFVIYRGVVAPFEAIGRFAEELGFCGFVACALAFCVVPFLPSWGRQVAEVVKETEPEPLYMMFIAGRDAIGRGPVTAGQF